MGSAEIEVERESSRNNNIGEKRCCELENRIARSRSDQHKKGCLYLFDA